MCSVFIRVPSAPCGEYQRHSVVVRTARGGPNGQLTAHLVRISSHLPSGGTKIVCSTEKVE